MRDTVFDRDIWRNIVSVFPHTPVELLARTVKDQLADTNEYGRLRHIIKEQRTGSMALYVAFLDGLRKELFPELTEAFQEFVKTRDWEIMEEAISVGYNNARHYAETICSIYNTGKQMDDMQWVGDEIKKSLLTPLNDGKDKQHL
jgi:hypothetical protein